MDSLTIGLTGGTGFIGSKILTALVKAGHQVIALHRRDSSSFLPQHERLTWVTVNRMETELQAKHIDAVIHLATVYEPSLSLSDMDVINVNLPLRLLECAKLGGCPLFLNTDTFFSKPAFDYPHMRPYIRSKVELLHRLRLSAQSTSGLKVVNVRLEHVYGPDDSPRKFVPFVMRKLMAHEPLDLTPGEQLRDFIHVQDVVAAYLVLINSANRLPDGVTEIEVGTGTANSVRTFVQTAKKVSGSRSALNFGAQPYRDGEIMHSVANIAAISATGWVPRLTLRNGIISTLNAMAVPR